MTFYLPGWMWIAIAAALYIFYAVNKSNKNRRQSRKEVFRIKQEQLLNIIRSRDKNSTEEQNENS